MAPALASALTGRRAELAAAAMEVVDESGLRGLTHRAVDARAGFPVGTCSAYLRSREALLTALAEHVGAILRADVDALAARLPAGCADEDVVAGTTALLQGWVRRPALVRVRAELTLEALRSPALLEIFLPWREALVETVAGVGVLAARPDATRRATALVSALEGVLVGALLQPESRRRAYVAETVEVLLDAFRSAAGDRPGG